MNRERLTILRDHLASLPDERVNMAALVRWPSGPDHWSRKTMAEIVHNCGTACCVAGWANALFNPDKPEISVGADDAEVALGLTWDQKGGLFFPYGWPYGRQTRSDAIAAIQSMLDSPDDDALPVWPDSNITGAGK